MKQIIKKILPEIIIDYYRKISYSQNKAKSKFIGKQMDETFTEIYKNNYWQSEASISGPGSDLLQTAVIRESLPKIFSTYNIKTLLDVPCGDFHWMKEIDFNNITYSGMDIVPEVIKNNIAIYSKTNISFHEFDITNTIPPQVDLIVCRDCLVHFSYQDIYRAISNIVASKSKYLLTTSFVNRRLNYDIITGDWRAINLEIAPFLFPKPMQTIIENCTENNNESNDKALCLWEVNKINLANFVL